MLLLAAMLEMLAQDGSEVYKKASPSVVCVTVERADGQVATGSGFLAIRDGLLVTAWHLVSGAKNVIATFPDGAAYDCSGLVDKDERRDVALVRVKVADRPLLNFADTLPPVGSACFIVGSPKGLSFSISGGQLNPTRTENGTLLLQFSCPAYSGNSGGPLLNASGDVLGVVSCQVRGSESLSFAAPAAAIKGLDTTLSTTPWDKVLGSPAFSSVSALLDSAVLGLPNWQGQREGFYEGTNSVWNVHLAYKSGARATTDNVALGIAFMEGTEADSRFYAFRASDIRLVHDYLNQSLSKDTIEALPRSRNQQTFTLKGVPFITRGVVYEATDLAVTFEVNPKSSNKGARWKYTLKAGSKTRWLNKDEADQLRSTLARILLLLGEVGIKL